MLQHLFGVVCGKQIGADGPRLVFVPLVILATIKRDSAVRRKVLGQAPSEEAGYHFIGYGRPHHLPVSRCVFLRGVPASIKAALEIDAVHVVVNLWSGVEIIILGLVAMALFDRVLLIVSARRPVSRIQGDMGGDG